MQTHADEMSCYKEHNKYCIYEVKISTYKLNTMLKEVQESSFTKQIIKYQVFFYNNNKK